MEKYRKMLILQYFFEKKEQYCIEELVRGLGISYTKILTLIEELIKNNMLKYNNYLLEITELGRQNIQKNDIYVMNNNNDILNVEIGESRKMDKFDIYIPKRFLKKI